MTVVVQRRLLRSPDLSPRNALRLAHGLAAGALLVISGCSGSSHSTSLGTSAPPAPATYTIGGSVSGLSGSGLVLANGSTTLSVAAGATSFVFPTAVISGTAYAVTVQASPTGETCSVAGGSSTVQTANVTGIVITCAATASSFTLGGQVGGLTASGLILQNGSDTVSVPSGATSYSFPTAVAPSSSYTVAVQAEPTGLYCSVTNASGTMPAHAVSNANVSCSTTPFTVGGTITGLNGSGLILTNGTATVAVTSGATSFAIPTTFNTSYTIGVQTQPTGVTCAVSGAASTGTMPAGNVTGVTLTCSDQTYSLGGSVSGNTNGGLVLSDSIETVTVAANAPSFTFPHQVPYSTPYTVSVQTSPAGLSCAVTTGNGAQTMPANNVNTLQVTCSPQSYSVGGTVSGLGGRGLTGNSLILQNNSGDNTTVLANATSFTMNSSVPSGTMYDITVYQQPRGFNCSVTSGTASGTVTTAAVTSVAVTCTENPVWAYSADYNNGLVLTYAVDTTNHDALTLSGTTYPSDGNTVMSPNVNLSPTFVTVNAAGTMLYVVNRGYNEVSWFSINGSTGALTYVNTAQTGSIAQAAYTPQMIVFNDAGTLAFVPDQGNDFVSVFSVDGSGNLTAVTGSPFAVATTHPQGMGPAYAAPSSIAVNPVHNLIYVTNLTSGEIANFAYDPTSGLLTQGTSILAGASPNDLVLDPTAAYAYASDRYFHGGSVLDFSLDASGLISYAGYVEVSPSSAADQPVSIAIDPSGKFLYTANNAATTEGISQFTIDPSTHLAGYTAIVAAPLYPAYLLADPVTDYMYLVTSGSPTASINQFSIDPSAGTLSPVGTANGPSGSAQAGVAIAYQ